MASGADAPAALAPTADDSGDSALPQQDQRIIDAALVTVFVVLYAFVFFIFTFFNVALVACVLRIFDGVPAGLGYGLGVAVQRLPAIIGWSLIVALVGMALKIIESRGSIFTRYLAIFGSIAWGLATFFVFPIMVAENQGPIRSIRGSVSLIKGVWGKFIVVNIGTRSLLGLSLFLIGGSAMLFASLTTQNNVMTSGRDVAILFTVFPGLAVIALLCISAISTIAHVALYYYAREKQAPPPYDDVVLQNAIRPKRA